MPTYDYECTKCGHEFCVEQSMNDRPLKKCRKCGGKLRKLLPRSLNLIFKGSGFYITDYKKSGGPGGSGNRSAEPGDKSAEPGDKSAGPGDRAVGSDTETS